MKYKTTVVDGVTYIVTDDKGMPIVIDEKKGEEKEFGIDAIHLYAKVPDLSNQLTQAKENMERAKSALQALKEAEIGFDNSDDEKFKEWLDAVKESQKISLNLDDAKKKSAEEIELIKKTAKEESEKKLRDTETRYKKLLEEKTAELAKERTNNFETRLRNEFANSKYVRENLHVPPAMAFDHFKQYFAEGENQDGEKVLVGYKTKKREDSDKILSESTGFNSALFDEAIRTIVDAHPDRDQLLTAKANSGTGTQGSSTYTLNGNPVKNPWMKDNLNITEQMLITRKDPQMAAKMKHEAGAK